MTVEAPRGTGTVRRPLRAAGALALVAGALALAPAAPAAAAARCSAVVTPGAADVAADTDVADAVESLRAVGAVPWVRVWASVPGGDLPAAVDKAAAACPKVAGDPAGLAPDVVVVAVSLDDRKSGIYYGSAWDAALDPWWADALAAEVNPLLQAGDVAGAVVAGLTGVESQLPGTDASGGTTGGTSSGTDGDGTTGGEPFVDAEPFVGTEPFVTDGSQFCDGPVPGPGLGPAPSFDCDGGTGIPTTGVLGVGGVVAALVGGGVGISRWTTRRRARDGAVAAAALAASARTSLTDDLAALRAVAAGVTAGLADGDAADVRARVEEAGVAAAAADRLVEAQERQYPQAGLAALATISARAADAGWSAAATRVAEARDRVEALRHGLDADAAAVADLGPQTDALTADLPAARARVGAMTEQGFTVDESTAALDAATADLARSRADREAGSALTAARTVAAAREAVRAAVAAAEGLPARRDAVLAAAGAVAERLDAARAAATTAGEGFARLRAGYDASCWSDLATGAEEAPGLVERATAGVEDAQVAASLRSQRWADAEAAASSARQGVDAVLALAGTVTERVAAVEEAQRTLAGRRDRADAVQQDAATYVARHRRDVPGEVADTVTAVGARLREVREGLAAPRPAWLRLEVEVARAERELTVAVAAARDAHERAERRRRDEEAAERRRRDSSAVGTASAFSGFSGSSDSGSSGSSGSGSMGGGTSSW